MFVSMRASLETGLPTTRSLLGDGQSPENKDEDKAPSHDTCDHLNEKD